LPGMNFVKRENKNTPALKLREIKSEKKGVWGGHSKGGEKIRAGKEQKNGDMA